MPEYSAENKKYTYKATENPLPVQDSEGVKYNAYYVKENTSQSFTNYSLREFNCTVNWNDSAHSSDIIKPTGNTDEDKARFAELIKDKFDLIDETDPDHPRDIFSYTEAQLQEATNISEEDKEYIRSKYDPIKDSNDEVIGYKMPDSWIEYRAVEKNGSVDHYELVVKNLFEITKDGTAKIYSLQPKNESIPVNDVDTKTGDAYAGSADDSYQVYSVNQGVRSNIVNKTYSGGTLNFLLTGNTQFTGSLSWADLDNQAARIAAVNNGTAGDFMLYRYVDKPDGETMISQVGTWNINSGDTYLYTDSDGKSALPKYDNTGAAYFYFAKERLSAVMGEYGVEYTVPDSETHFPFNDQGGGVYNEAKVFPNGASVKNSLVGSIAYGVDAQWIAAQLQGGTAEAHYGLQYFDPSTQEWVTAPKVQAIDPVTGEPKMIDNTVDITGFAAEVMELDGTFYAVRKYDTDGNRIRYRVVQTQLKRTDNGVDGYDNVPLNMAYALNGDLILSSISGSSRKRVKLLNANNEEVDTVRVTIGTGNNANDFEVSVELDEQTQTFYYKYRLVGEVEAIVNKEWVGVPKNMVQKIYNGSVDLQLMVYNYKTGNYVPFNEDNGNNGNIKYYNGTRDENNQLVEQTTGDDKTGVFNLKRTDTVTYSDWDANKSTYAIQLLNLPLYDEYGHLNRFSLTEQRVNVDGTLEDHYVNYTVDIKHKPMVFTATNAFGGQGEHISLQKVWMDDGEEEYKSDVRINLSARAMPIPDNSAGSQETVYTGWETATNIDVWLGDSSHIKPASTGNGGYFPDHVWGNVDSTCMTDPLIDQRGLGSIWNNTDQQYYALPAPQGSTGPLDINNYPGIDQTYLNGYNTTLQNAYNQKQLVNPGLELNEENVYFSSLLVRTGYSYVAPEGYDLKDFQEYLTSSKITAHDFTFRDDDIVETPTDKWISMLPEQYADGTKGNVHIIGGTVSVTVENKTTDSLSFKLQRKQKGADDTTYTDVQTGSVGASGTNTISDLPASDSTHYYEYRVTDNSGALFDAARAEFTVSEPQNIKTNIVDLDKLGAQYTYTSGNTTKEPVKLKWFAGVYKATYNKNNGYDRYYGVLETPVYSGKGTISLTATRKDTTDTTSPISFKIARRLEGSNDPYTLVSDTVYTIQAGQTSVEVTGLTASDGNNYYDFKIVDSTNTEQELTSVTKEMGRLNRRLVELIFTNIRIGTINYKISFDWNVGNKINEMKNVTVKIMADYHDGTDPHPVLVPSDASSTGFTDEINIEMLPNVEDYYITNLPKYTSTGEIITYSVTEMKVNDISFIGGKCSLDGDDLYFESEELPYEVNPKSNSDDLCPIVIKNTFKGTTDCTVYKIWKDDSNALNTRADLYIQLYQHSTNPEGPGDTQKGLDYLWKRRSTDSLNNWSYTYSGLDKYDAKGYRYEYYVKEVTTNLVPDEYRTYYENIGHMSGTTNNNKTYYSSDSVFRIKAEDVGDSFSFTINGVDALDDDYIDESMQYYDFRVKDTNGTVLKETDGITLAKGEVTNGKVNVTVTKSEAPTENFSFYLERKTKGQSDSDYQRVSETPYIISAGQTVCTINDLDARDGKYVHEPSQYYDFRAADLNGVLLSGVEVTTSSVSAEGTVTLTVSKTGGAEEDFVFLLQRKIHGEQPEYSTDGNNQQILVDDKYTKVPDFYEFSGQSGLSDYVDHSTFDGKIKLTQDGDGNITEGRAYDHGTITNRLESTVKIEGEKIWQNIAAALEKYNYPIADIFLYANVKSKRNEYTNTVLSQTGDFTQGGYQLIGGTDNAANPEDALGELVNIASIHGGDTEYSFTHGGHAVKQNGEYQYQSGTDYVQFGNKTTLDKYDENGALISYTLKERAINGYTFRIGNGKIINEYNGGDRVQVKVTKTWDHMTAGIEYPTVKFTLHQCYVGKTAEDSNELALLEYQSFSQTIRATNNDPIVYTFGAEGNKEVLREYSPTGEKFFYYVTEELTDANNQGRVHFRKTYSVDEHGLNTTPQLSTYNYASDSTVNGELSGLGFKCTISEAEDENGDFTGTTVPIHKKVDITNDYQPEEAYYQSLITVNKNWEKYDAENQNPLNDEFNGINDYSFVLKRKTKYIFEKALFRVKTDSGNNDGLPSIDLSARTDATVTTSVSFDFTDKYVDVTVTKPTGNEDAFDFKLQRTTDNGTTYQDVGIYTISANETYYTITGLPAYTGTSAADFRVVDTTTESGSEISGAGITLGTQTDITADAVDLTVTRQSDSGSLGFTLQRSADNGNNFEEVGRYTIPSGEPSLVINSVIAKDGNGNSYSFRVVDNNKQEISGTTVSSSAADPVGYYTATITVSKDAYSFGDIDVNVRVYKNDKKVEIRGLAIYGQDAVPYTYIVTEDNNMKAFEPVTATKSDQIKTTTDPTTQKVTGGYAKIDLDNRVKSFTLRLDKLFGTEYDYIDEKNQTVRKYEPIDPEDYPLYFNEAFLNRLKFTLQRRKQNQSPAAEWEDYIHLNVNQSQSPAAIVDNRINDPSNTTLTITAPFESYSADNGYNLKGQYYYDFKYIPREDKDGVRYEYRVVELDTSVGDYVKIFYPDSIAPDSQTALPGDNAEIQSGSKYFANNDPKVLNSNLYGTVHTYARNIFEGKQIEIRKYWNDSNNADNLRPETLEVTLHEYFTLSQDREVQIKKLLKNSENWNRSVFLPKYYYNGDAPVSNVTFSVEEDLETATLYGSGSPTLKTIGYEKEDQGYIRKVNGTEYLVHSDFSDSLQGTSDNEFAGLYLKNKKDRINSKLTFEKKWDDKQNELHLRPDSFFIKTVRRTKGSAAPTDDGSITISSDTVDFNQPTIFENLPKTTDVNSPYVYFIETGNNITSTTEYKSDSAVVNVDLSKAVETNVSFKLKRRIAGYEFKQYEYDNTNHYYSIPVGDIIAGTVSFRLPGVDIADNGVNYVYRIANISGTAPLPVSMKHYPLNDKQKDIVVTASTTSKYNFKVQRSSDNGETWQEVNNIVIQRYFDETVPLKLYSPSGGYYTIAQSDKYGDTYGFKVLNLPASSDYRIADKEGNPINADIRVVQNYNNDNNLKDIIVMVNGISTVLEFVVQKSDDNGENFTTYSSPDMKVGKYYEEVVTKDQNGSKLRFEYFPVSAVTTDVTVDNYDNIIGFKDQRAGYTYTASSGTFTVAESHAFKNKYSVLIQGLDIGTDYTVTASSGGSNLTTEDRPVSSTKKDILVTANKGTGDLVFTIAVNEGTLPENLKAVRFFKGDTNGIIELPADLHDATYLAENLAYGMSGSDASETANGSWEKYYYTVVECSDQGVDDQSTMTYSQTVDTESASTPTAKKLTFELNTEGYHPKNADPSTYRKYLNIKVVDELGEDNYTTIKKDINGSPIKVTLTCLDENGDVMTDENGNSRVNDYFASDQPNNIPVEGVIVIPIPTYCDKIRCEIDNLPTKLSDGTNEGRTPSYTVQRCKASGKMHSEALPFIQIEDQNVKIEDSQPQSTTAKFTYEKTWDKDAKNHGLRPANVYFALFRTHESGTEENNEKEEFVSSITMPVSSDSVGETISSLPAGKFVDKEGIGFVWEPYSYYIKEYTSAYNNDYPTAADEKSFNNLYKSGYIIEPDKPFVLDTTTYDTATLDQGLENKLQTTKHEVVVEWDDFDDASKLRDNYVIALQRNNGTGWEDVDLRDVVVTRVDLTKEGDDEIKTFTRVPTAGGSEAVKTLPIDKDKLYYCFDLLPVYDDSGLEYSYRVEERKIGSYDVNEHQIYLFLVPGTDSEDAEYSYVRSIRRGTKNYYVAYDALTGYEYTDEDGTVYSREETDEKKSSFSKTKIINSLTLNIVSFVNYKATKKWDDENNLYGLRPDKITYTLKRTKTLNGTTEVDSSFASPKEGNESNNWTAEWSQCAAFAADGGAFDYYIEEETVNYYTTKEETNEGPDTMVYTFTNTYVPELKNLKAVKVWEDNSDLLSMRPDNIKYSLYCKYDVYSRVERTDENNETYYEIVEEDPYEGLVYDPDKTEDEQSQVYKTLQELNASSNHLVTEAPTQEDFIKTLSSANKLGTDKNTWSVTFNNLPCFVNTCSSSQGQIVGKASEVTYYIVETVDGKTEKVYKCADAADTKTSDSKELKLYAVSDSTAVYNANNGMITVPKSASYNGELSVLISDLPSHDIYGKKYTYTVNGDELTCQESGFHDNTKGTTSVVVSEKLPDIYFRVQRKVSTDGDPETVIKDENGDRLTVTINGVTYKADSTGLFTVPRVYTNSDNTDYLLNAQIPDLPAKDRSNRNYTYTIQECYSSGAVLSPAAENPVTISQATVDGKFKVTVKSRSAAKQLMFPSLSAAE